MILRQQLTIISTIVHSLTSASIDINETEWYETTSNIYAKRGNIRHWQLNDDLPHEFMHKRTVLCENIQRVMQYWSTILPFIRFINNDCAINNAPPRRDFNTLHIDFVSMEPETCASTRATTNFIKINKNIHWTMENEYNRYDISSVLLHEVGHYLGLLHNNELYSPMFPHYIKRSKEYINKGSIHITDVKNLAILYKICDRNDYRKRLFLQANQQFTCFNAANNSSSTTIFTISDRLFMLILLYYFYFREKENMGTII